MWHPVPGTVTRNPPSGLVSSLASRAPGPLGCGGRTGGSRHTDSRRGWAAVQNPAFLTGQSAGSVLPINGCEGSGDRLDDKAQNSSHKIQFLCIHPPLNRTHQWSATEHSRSSSVFIRGVCINQVLLISRTGGKHDHYLVIHS